VKVKAGEDAVLLGARVAEGKSRCSSEAKGLAVGSFSVTACVEMDGKS